MLITSSLPLEGLASWTCFWLFGLPTKPGTCLMDQSNLCTTSSEDIMTYFFHHAGVSLTHGSLGSVSNKSTILLKNALLLKWLSNWDHCSMVQRVNWAWSTWQSESLQTEKKNLLEQWHMRLCGLLLLLVHGCGLLMIWSPAADLLLLMMAQWKCGDKPVGMIRVREVFEKFKCLPEEVCTLSTGPSCSSRSKGLLLSYRNHS